jgi:hypothetical protein
MCINEKEIAELEKETITELVDLYRELEAKINYLASNSTDEISLTAIEKHYSNLKLQLDQLFKESIYKLIEITKNKD